MRWELFCAAFVIALVYLGINLRFAANLSFWRILRAIHLWVLPQEQYAGKVAPMEPYYILMKFP